MNTKKKIDAEPQLWLLLDLVTRHESQTTMLRDLMQDVLKKIREGDDELADAIEKRLRIRQLKLLSLQQDLAQGFRDNFELTSQILKARVVRTTPRTTDIWASGAPFPLTARQREVMKKDISTLNLTSRARSCLRTEGVETIEQLLELREGDLMKIPNLGKTSLKSVRSALELYDFKLGHLYDPNKPIPRAKWLGEE